MAIFHLSMKAIGRGGGRCSTAAAAYRAAEKIIDERTGLIFDFKDKRRGVADRLLMMPPEVDWKPTRAAFWNAVEKKNVRADSVMAREIEAALPHELSPAEHQKIVRQFVEILVEKYKVGADACTHRPGKKNDPKNVHVHILLSTNRVIGPNQFGNKARELDAIASKRAEGGATQLEFIRSTWADLCNEALEANGFPHELIDHRSFQRQHKTELPVRHEPRVDTEMKKREGTRTKSAEGNDAVRKTNALLREKHAVDQQIYVEQRRPQIEAAVKEIRKEQMKNNTKPESIDHTQILASGNIRGRYKQAAYSTDKDDSSRYYFEKNYRIFQSRQKLAGDDSEEVEHIKNSAVREFLIYQAPDESKTSDAANRERYYLAFVERVELRDNGQIDFYTKDGGRLILTTPDKKIEFMKSTPQEFELYSVSRFSNVNWETLLVDGSKNFEETVKGMYAHCEPGFVRTQKEIDDEIAQPQAESQQAQKQLNGSILWVAEDVPEQDVERLNFNKEDLEEEFEPENPLQHQGDDYAKSKYKAQMWREHFGSHLPPEFWLHLRQVNFAKSKQGGIVKTNDGGQLREIKNGVEFSAYTQQEFDLSIEIVEAKKLKRVKLLGPSEFQKRMALELVASGWDPKKIHGSDNIDVRTDAIKIREVAADAVKKLRAESAPPNNPAWAFEPKAGETLEGYVSRTTDDWDMYVSRSNHDFENSKFAGRRAAVDYFKKDYPPVADQKPYQRPKQKLNQAPAIVDRDGPAM